MNKLINLIERYSVGLVHEIKLKDILELRKPGTELREISTCFPPLEIGSITLVDQIVLLSLVELINPETIIEIGTFQGFSTRLFLKNTMSKVFSLDLPWRSSKFIEAPKQDRLLSDGNYNDDYLRDLQNKTGEIYLKDINLDEMSRLFLIKHDSTTFDYPSHIENAQFAFIDGGHQCDIVREDTNNMRNMLKETGGVIVWHDYSSTIHSDVTNYLNLQSKENKIFYIRGSLCAFQYIEPSL